MSDNIKTILYAAVMTLIVALVLATLTSFLRPIQKVQEDRDKKVNILKAVEYNDDMDPEAEYAERIKEIVINAKGEAVEGKKAFDIDLYKEGKKPVEERLYPLYVYTADTKKEKFIIPMNGMGLWDQIGGFIAIKDDFNTVDGATFTHVGETPGLGAEITADWFQSQFKNKSIKDATGKFAFKVLKGVGNSLNDYTVDGITGSTITCDGVNAMMSEDIGGYTQYFNKTEKQQMESRPTKKSNGLTNLWSTEAMEKAKGFFKLGKNKLANQIEFQGRTSIVSDASLAQIQSLVSFLNGSPAKKVKIIVNDRKDDALSARRAQALYTYALQHGANENQLSFNGIKDRDTSDRIEFELLN